MASVVEAISELVQTAMSNLTGSAADLMIIDSGLRSD